MTIAGRAADRVPRAAIWLVVAASVVLIVAGLRFASFLVAPLFLAFMLAVVLAPLVRWLEHLGLPTSLAVVGVLAIAIGLLLCFLFLVSVQLSELSKKLPEYQAMLSMRIQDFVTTVEHKPPDDQQAAASASEGSAALIQAVAGALSALLQGVVVVVFFLFLLCLLLASERSFERTLRLVVPPDRDFHRRFAEYLKQVEVQSRIRGLSNVFSAIALTAVFVLFRIDFALLWGLLCLVLGYIPNIGLIIACTPAVVLAFIQYGTGVALLMLAVAILVNAAVDNIVIPRFISRTADLPMVIVFLSFIFWGWMFGLLGAIISTNATLLVRTLLDGSPETRGLARLLSAAPRDPD